MLEAVEQPLDLVAVPIAPEVASRRLTAVRLGRDDRQDAAPQQLFADGVAIIALVGELGVRLGHGHVEQRWHGTVIRDLAPGQDEAKRASLTVTAGVDLARKAAAASTKALLAGPPLWMARPLTERCCLTAAVV